MRTNRLWLGTAVLGAVTATCHVRAGETDIDLGISAGYDDNPYRVTANEKAGGFIDLDASLDYEAEVSDISKFFVAANGDVARFSGGVGDASDWSAAVKSGLEFYWRPSNGNRLRLNFGAGARLQRGTFVSRFTGRIGTINGTEVPERMDYGRGDLFVETDYYVGRNIKLSLDVDFKDKNYVEDYANLGADRLDHEEQSVRPSLRYTIAGDWRVQVFGAIGTRDYKNRTVDDVLGNSIPNTRRRYDYREYGGELEFAPSDTQQWAFGVSSGDRTDNGVGYWNYDMADYYVSLDQSFGTDANLSVKIYHTAKEYANVIQVANPEEQYERTGNGIDVRFSRELGTRSARGVTLFAELDYFDGTASSARSVYKRAIVLVGITKPFGTANR